MKLSKLILAVAFATSACDADANEASFAEAVYDATGHGQFAIEAGTGAITTVDLKRYVNRLASTEYEGRGTGERGERMATAYLASFFEGLKLKAEGDGDSYYQTFSFDAGKVLEGENGLVIGGEGDKKSVREFEPGKGYQPVGFSPSGKVGPVPVVFAGFGIQTDGYDSFEGLDVKGKWILVLRGTPARRKDLAKFGPLVAKAQTAKKLGVAGIVFIKGTNPAISTELIPTSANVGARGEMLPAISLKDLIAAEMILEGEKGEDLKELFEQYHGGDEVAGFALPHKIGVEIGLKKAQGEGRNVIGRLMVGEEPTEETIVIGAHIDHLGYGRRGGSRAKGDDAKKAHLGADDNASGVAAMMELAQHYAEKKRKGAFDLKRDLVFAGWSGEEMGLQGSRHFVKKAKGGPEEAMYPATAAYLNLDMVGRLRDQPLTINGTGSSKAWKAVLDGLEGDLKIERSEGPYLPTDSTSFYTAGVPVLALFTGLHSDYHKPTDTADKIDFEGLGRISNYLKALTEKVANLESAPKYVAFARPSTPKVVIGIRSEDVADDGGIRISEVVADSPAERAGIREGDILGQLDGKRVENFQGLLRILRKLEADKEYAVVLGREDMEVEVKLVPAKR